MWRGVCGVVWCDVVWYVLGGFPHSQSLPPPASLVHHASPAPPPPPRSWWPSTSCRRLCWAPHCAAWRPCWPRARPRHCPLWPTASRVGGWRWRGDFRPPGALHAPLLASASSALPRAQAFTPRLPSHCPHRCCDRLPPVHPGQPRGQDCLEPVRPGPGEPRRTCRRPCRCLGRERRAGSAGRADGWLDGGAGPGLPAAAGPQRPPAGRERWGRLPPPQLIGGGHHASLRHSGSGRCRAGAPTRRRAAARRGDQQRRCATRRCAGLAGGWVAAGGVCPEAGLCCRPCACLGPAPAGPPVALFVGGSAPGGPWPGEHPSFLPYALQPNLLCLWIVMGCASVV